MPVHLPTVSAVPPGLVSLLHRYPALEALGYFRASLRDWIAGEPAPRTVPSARSARLFSSRPSGPESPGTVPQRWKDAATFEGPSGTYSGRAPLRNGSRPPTACP